MELKQPRVQLGLALGVAVLVTTATGLGQGATGQSGKVFDGRWWLAASHEERSGFLEGSADCLTWVAGLHGYSNPSGQLAEKITQRYQENADLSASLVVHVWASIREELPAGQGRGGDVWSKPHWYLNGLWWRQASVQERRGFLEGYLGCLREQVSQSEAVYSESLDSYYGRIENYVEGRPDADDEALATILERFKDVAPK